MSDKKEKGQSYLFDPSIEPNEKDKKHMEALAILVKKMQRRKEEIELCRD
ncbi:MAG: hypothetical protein V1851_02795 [Patescibacteria group bacterium]